MQSVLEHITAHTHYCLLRRPYFHAEWPCYADMCWLLRMTWWRPPATWGFFQGRSLRPRAFRSASLARGALVATCVGEPVPPADVDPF